MVLKHRQQQHPTIRLCRSLRQRFHEIFVYLKSQATVKIAVNCCLDRRMKICLWLERREVKREREVSSLDNNENKKLLWFDLHKNIRNFRFISLMWSPLYNLIPGTNERQKGFLLNHILYSPFYLAVNEKLLTRIKAVQIRSFLYFQNTKNRLWGSICLVVQSGGFEQLTLYVKYFVWKHFR